MRAFSKNKVLIIGDLMVDHYVYGEIHRQSPEAPVPVIAQTNKASHAGGAANVALNILGLEATPTLIGVIGNDREGETLLELLNQKGISTDGIIKDASRLTTSKTRIIAEKNHIARIDSEDTHPIGPIILERIIGYIKALPVNSIDIAILQDYNKGVFNGESISQIIAALNAKGISFVVDPKEKNFFDFIGPKIFKPNLSELHAATKVDVTKVEDIQDQIIRVGKRINAEIAMVTMGGNGLMVCQGDHCIHIKAVSIEDPDVCGAGDAVISLSALAFANRLDLDILAQLANQAGALACRQVGVNPIRLIDLK